MTLGSAKKQHASKWVHWSGKTDLTQKPKALCKPCWELRYCPYGALVEGFPLPHDRNDPKGCRIFGHECPVFHVAESITETKELRRVSREIPQAVKVRVLFRDNRICAGCNNPIPVDQVHYDHIIPWTKGGPSEEHNVQLLCRKCNLSKGKDFEESFLVKNFHDHLRKPVGTEFVKLLLTAASFAVEFRQQQGGLPNAEQFAKAVGLRKATDAEKQIVELFSDLEDFFCNRPRKNFTRALFDALRHRWGWSDGHIYGLKESAKKHGVDPTVLAKAEMNLVGRLGWPVKSGDSVLAQWLRK